MIRILKNIFLCCCFCSCTLNKETSINIIDSSSRIIKTITPEKDINYTTKYIRIRGYSDDSIYVKFGENGLPFYFRKNIDTTLAGDYYGPGKVTFIFDPYKSKKKKLQISFGILGSK